MKESHIFNNYGKKDRKKKERKRKKERKKEREQ